MPLVLVTDGKIVHRNLEQLGKTEDWVALQCRRRGICSLEDVFLLTLDDCGNFFIQAKSAAGDLS